MVRGAQDGTSPAGWQSCLGRFPSPLRTTKMAFRPLWHAIEAPHAPSAATQSRRRPSARASTRCLRGVGWLTPRQDGAMPPMPTRRAPSVLGVCGWVSAPRTAHPCVGNALGLFTWGQCSAVSGRAAHYHTLEQPQSLNTRPTCAPRGRGPITRTLSSTHGPEESTSSDSALVQAVPASLYAPHAGTCPRVRHHPTP